MSKAILNPIIPRPILVETENLKGKLYVEGCLEQNYIRFRFKFDEPGETAPISILVYAAGKEYAFNCIIVDYEKNETKTVIFHPEFFIGSQFNIVNVDPLVKFCRINEN